MTEDDWAACEDAAAMVRFLGAACGERKMRLFACACARSRWSEIDDDTFRSAVETAERWADGLAGREALREAELEAWYASWGTAGDPTADQLAQSTVEELMPDALASVVELATRDAPRLLREILGSRPREARTIAADLRRDPQVSDLARAIYDDRRFEDLPRLAQRLRDTGCDDGELLAHLSSPGPHVRGCWALDAVLGRGAGKDIFTKAEWLAETHPFHMLTWWRYLRGEPTERALRLLACACCRRLPALLAEEPLRRAVDVAEAFADGRADAEALQAAHDDVLSWSRRRMDQSRPAPAGCAPAASVTELDVRLLGNAMHAAALDGGQGRNTEDADQAHLVREILGNPFRTISVDVSRLRRSHPACVDLARAIYEERAFERLPTLAGALQEAGDVAETILVHLREPGPHVRGCWALDAILGVCDDAR